MADQSRSNRNDEERGPRREDEQVRSIADEGPAVTDDEFDVDDDLDDEQDEEDEEATF